MISFSILITSFLDTVWILLGEVNSQSLLGIKGSTSSANQHKEDAEDGAYGLLSLSENNRMSKYLWVS